MTPEEKARIRELPKLIAHENDPAKMRVLAAELVRLLTTDAKYAPLDLTAQGTSILISSNRQMT